MGLDRPGANRDADTGVGGFGCGSGVADLKLGLASTTISSSVLASRSFSLFIAGFLVLSASLFSR
jgi:hypothetical protein